MWWDSSLEAPGVLYRGPNMRLRAARAWPKQPARHCIVRGTARSSGCQVFRCQPPWLQWLPTQGQDRPDQVANWASDSVEREPPSQLGGAVGFPDLLDGSAVGLVVALCKRPRLFAPMQDRLRWQQDGGINPGPAGEHLELLRERGPTANC